MTLEQLRDEYRTERIGLRWLAEVRSVARSVTSSYSPEIYADGLSWQSALEDLVQEVVTERLLREGQAAYLIDVAATYDDFRRLLARQIRLTLARQRRRTIVDQLLSRSRRLLGSDPFILVEAPTAAWTLPGTQRELRAPTPRELRQACDAVRVFPRVIGRGYERASTVYRTKDLRALLEVVVRDLPTPVRLKDLDAIFCGLLTPLLPSDLDPGAPPPGGAPAFLSPEDDYRVESTVNELLSTLSDDQSALLRAKLNGVSDSDIAANLGLSRPTAAKRKTEVMRVLSERMSDLPQDLAARVVAELGVRLSAGTTS
jgi:hypothetical protein